MSSIDFNFRSSIKDVQNRLISQSIRNTSNLELLNSEESIQAVIKSYTDRFNSIGGMLFDVSKYIVKSKEVIDISSFNEIFDSIYIDLASLYADLDLVENVLNLNLQRNKNFFLVIKKRIKDLWSKLNLTRLYIYDQNPADESFYESFFTNLNATRVQNVKIDKKNGFLHLSPKLRRVHNESFEIKKITTSTYPVNSDNGGALHTTSELNTLEENYNNGPRDMLKNGLWKEEIICKEIPNLIHNIGSATASFKRNYKGILSLVDIEYAYPVEINRLDADIYGDKPVLIDAILYKSTENDDWHVANFSLEDPLEEDNPNTITKRNAVRGEAFDVIPFYNISKIRAKYLRLVFNQRSYEFVDSDDSGKSDLDLKINNDLSQRRYELVKFGANYQESLATPVNDENTSLYNKIIKVIDSVSNIESILNKIEELLIPSLDVVTYDFSRAIKFELGAWSIDPTLEIYEKGKGIFDSIAYELRDKSLSSVSIKTGQKVPEATTCNWYVNINNRDVPIAENGTVIRKEPIEPISMSKYSNFKHWSPGSFISLDFPLDPLNISKVGIYTNGQFHTVEEGKIAALNSKLLYIKNLEDPYRSEFVIRYPCAMYSSVNLYTLSLKPSASTGSEFLPLGIIASRREVLEDFIDSVKYRNTTGALFSHYLNKKYSINNIQATYLEAKDWFGANFESCLFIATEVLDYLDQDDLLKYKYVIRKGDSKLGSTKNNMLNYFSGNDYGYSDLNILGSIANVAPLGLVRTL